jgi:predicted AAA+ superfamily ATPase
MLLRHVEARLRRALDVSPVTLLVGPRGAGKSTLARAVVAGERSFRALSLDDPLDLAEAARDPRAVAAAGDLVVLDEVERLAGLAAAVAAEVARDPAPGRFLLTASVLGPTLRALVARLGDRVATVQLWPLSAGELAGERERFVDALLAPDGRLGIATRPAPGDLAGRLARGGLPGSEDLGARDRGAFLGDRLGAVLERDVRAVAHLDTLAELPRLLAAAVASSGASASFAELARAAGLPQTTVKRHLALLEATFLLHRVPAWDGGRTVRAPRLVPADSGLACHLLRLDAARLAADPAALAGLLPAYVLGEVARQASWGPGEVRLSHFATYGGDAVDAVVEDAAGGLAAVSVCAREAATPRDARGLAALARLAGERFRRGVVLHLGDRIAQLADGIVAMPLPALWTPSSPRPAARPLVPPVEPAGPVIRPRAPVHTSGCIWDPGAGW